MKTVFLFISTLIILNLSAQNISIIPTPIKFELKEGNFILTSNTGFVIQDEGDRKTANFFNTYLKQFYGFSLKIGTIDRKNAIRLYTKKFIQTPENDNYNLAVNTAGIHIEGDTYAGTFFGMQTLIQLLPVPKRSTTLNNPLSIPNCIIDDAPRFAYRGMHLDVGRHFYPVNYIKKYIDFLALHKFNNFHWHLTEDQGWRIEIKKYPELTKTGAMRNGTIIGRYPGKGNDNKPYGGSYTQEEIKEVVKYAADRFINVIPEIELPGHSSAAIAAYPWLSCFPELPTAIPANMISKKSIEEQATGRVKLVQETWGIFDDVFCAGKETTFDFLQQVLDEVIQLFPSKYVHIGGDECPKTHWKKCMLCQQRMKDLGLKDEHELQSYFIQRIEKYLNSKGKVLIGWDEILEGGLAPNAVVMSWRGEKGGIEAAQQNHKVIMTPGSHVYFDHTQSQQDDSVTIGGYSPLDKVYTYEPIPKELNADQAKYVLGAQANVWTEYMNNSKKIEYMIFPRMAALSEVLWSTKESRNWKNFESRLNTQLNRYDLWKANYSKAYAEINLTIKPTTNNEFVLVELKSNYKNGMIKYQLPDQTNWINYTSPFIISGSGNLKYAVFENDKLLSASGQMFSLNKATGKKITLTNSASKNYPGDGAFTLLNGIQNTKGTVRSREFLGFSGTDCEAIIDLGKKETIFKISAAVLRQESSWIYLPSSFEVQMSDDGIHFKTIPHLNSPMPLDSNIRKMEYFFPPVETRFIKILLKSYGTIPEGKPGAGNKAWLFVDEIEIF